MSSCPGTVSTFFWYSHCAAEWTLDTEYRDNRVAMGQCNQMATATGKHSESLNDLKFRARFPSHSFLSLYSVQFEEAMRSLGDQTEDGGHDYSCFALPYWYIERVQYPPYTLCFKIPSLFIIHCHSVDIICVQELGGRGWSRSHHFEVGFGRKRQCVPWILCRGRPLWHWALCNGTGPVPAQTL